MMGRSFQSIHFRMDAEEKEKLSMNFMDSCVTVTKDWRYLAVDGMLDLDKYAKSLSKQLGVPILVLSYQQQKHLIVQVITEGKKMATFLCDNKRALITKWNAWKQIFSLNEEEVQVLRYLSKEEKNIDNWAYLLSHILGTNLLFSGKEETFEKDFDKVRSYIREQIRKKVVMQVQREGMIQRPTTFRTKEEDCYYGVIRLVQAMPNQTLQNVANCYMLHKDTMLPIAHYPLNKKGVSVEPYIKESFCNTFIEREASKNYCIYEQTMFFIKQEEEQVVILRYNDQEQSMYRFPKNTKRSRLDLINGIGIICVKGIIVCLLKRTNYKDGREDSAYEVWYFDKELQLLRKKRGKLPTNDAITMDGFAYSVAREMFYFGQYTYDLRHESYYKCEQAIQGKVVPVLDKDGNWCVCEKSKVVILSPESQVVASCQLKGTIYYIYLNQNGNFCFITSDRGWNEGMEYHEAAFVRMYEVIS